jgi:hypothetical protein
MPRGDPNWLCEIVEIMWERGGKATLDEIHSAVVRRKNLDLRNNRDPLRTILGVLQKNCKDPTSWERKRDVFYRIRPGLWGHRHFQHSTAAPNNSITEGIERIRQEKDQTGGALTAKRAVPRRQRNLLRRQEVERIAIETTDTYFRSRFYRVRSAANDNVGWYLEATRDGETLLLEVKGLSQSTICVALTPNEFRQMQANRDAYRVCVVTDALKNPVLTVFAWSSETEQWENPEGARLEIEIIESARLTAVNEE